MGTMCSPGRRIGRPGGGGRPRPALVGRRRTQRAQAEVRDAVRHLGLAALGWLQQMTPTGVRPGAAPTPSLPDLIVDSSGSRGAEIAFWIWDDNRSSFRPALLLVATRL